VGRDRWTALGLAAFAVAYLVADRRYPLDTLATPGPGLFPLIAGLALLALAAWEFVTAAPHRARDPAGGIQEPPSPRGPLVMAAVLVLYVAVLPVVGFILASLALVFVSARLMGLGGWWAPAVLALGITLGSRVIFVTWLGVPLP
jgi:hypothetical protein